MTHAIPFTIEELCFVSVWIHEKGRSVRTCDDRRGNISLPFKKKEAQLRLVYINSRKKNPKPVLSQMRNDLEE
jgi:hypothetical protein